MDRWKLLLAAGGAAGAAALLYYFPTEDPSGDKALLEEEAGEGRKPNPKLTFSDGWACFRSFLFYMLFENCSRFRQDCLERLWRKAEEHQVVYHRGSKTIKNRLVYEYGERHQGTPNLKTIRPDGTGKEKPLSPGQGRIIKTFCFRQWLDDPTRPPEDPFTWKTRDGRCAVVEAWAGNAGKKFSETMVPMSDYEGDPDRVLLDDFEETVKAAKDFQTVLGKLFAGQALSEVKYWHGGESCSKHPIFIGTGAQLQGFLRDPEVQRQLLIKEFDGNKLVVFVVSMNPRRCGIQDDNYFEDVNREYVVYRREGESKFTCVMTHEQFRQDRGAGKDFDISDLSPVFCGQLGQGGFGKVYLMRDERGCFVERRGLVAVKQYARPNIDWLGYKERAVTELLKEARHRHPCLVKIYDVYYNSTGPHLCIVMEVCTTDLHDELRRHKIKGINVDLRTAKIWMGHIFLGLEHLHLRMEPSVVHRDLKPSNVLLDEQRQAKLADFGAARLGRRAKRSGTLSLRSMPPGTPGYIAPELVRVSQLVAKLLEERRVPTEEEERRLKEHGELDHLRKVDIYSFGVVCWRLLTTDYVPGERTCTDSLKHLQIASGKLRTKVEEDKATDQETRQFILGMLQSDPRDRFEHRNIREHEFFRDLGLPPFSPDVHVCQEWCNEQLAELRHA